jgi:hypothetical protein
VARPVRPVRKVVRRRPSAPAVTRAAVRFSELLERKSDFFMDFLTGKLEISEDLRH